jgi:hypothetical protein
MRSNGLAGCWSSRSALHMAKERVDIGGLLDKMVIARLKETISCTCFIPYPRPNAK